jgi:hypothetical protein
LETFQKKRDAEQIMREYDKNKWGVLLQRELDDVEHAKTVELTILPGRPDAIFVRWRDF